MLLIPICYEQTLQSSSMTIELESYKNKEQFRKNKRLSYEKEDYFHCQLNHITNHLYVLHNASQRGYIHL